jgi:hypothetical protein
MYLHNFLKELEKATQIVMQDTNPYKNVYCLYIKHGNRKWESTKYFYYYQSQEYDMVANYKNKATREAATRLKKLNTGESVKGVRSSAKRESSAYCDCRLKWFLKINDNPGDMKSWYGKYGKDIKYKEDECALCPSSMPEIEWKSIRVSEIPPVQYHFDMSCDCNSNNSYEGRNSTGNNNQAAARENAEKLKERLDGFGHAMEAAISAVAEQNEEFKYNQSTKLHMQTENNSKLLNVPASNTVSPAYLEGLLTDKNNTKYYTKDI